jgi:cyclic pyranopterin phosphate synthase
MVDVSQKAESARTATASAIVCMSAAAFNAVVCRQTNKGDPLAAAELAGIMGAKRTADLIPLCHPLALSSVTVVGEPDAASGSVRLTATVKSTGPTGVEMEALTAVTTAALTLYDMLKALDKAIVIESVQLVSKSGGASGEFRRGGDQP